MSATACSYSCWRWRRISSSWGMVAWGRFSSGMVCNRSSIRCCCSTVRLADSIISRRLSISATSSRKFSAGRLGRGGTCRRRAALGIGWFSFSTWIRSRFFLVTKFSRSLVRSEMICPSSIKSPSATFRSSGWLRVNVMVMRRRWGLVSTLLLVSSAGGVGSGVVGWLTALLHPNSARTRGTQIYFTFWF